MTCRAKTGGGKPPANDNQEDVLRGQASADAKLVAGDGGAFCEPLKLGESRTYAADGFEMTVTRSSRGVEAVVVKQGPLPTPLEGDDAFDFKKG
jgi:hypothetical protein